MNKIIVDYKALEQLIDYALRGYGIDAYKVANFILRTAKEYEEDEIDINIPDTNTQ